MPDSQQNTPASQNNSLRDGQNTLPPTSTESLQMLMANLGHQPNLPVNEVHVSEMLSQRRQINEFINTDKARDSYDKKYYLTVGLIFILSISCLVIFTYPEYFTQVLALIIGGFGGFGMGRASRQD